MKKNIIICSIIVLSVIVAISCTNNSKQSISEATQSKKDTTALIKRGEYLVTIGGCNDCHSPKMMTDHGPDIDPARMLSGHNENEPVPVFDNAGVSKGIIQTSMGLTAWRGPWGTSFTANLTPDETGLGNWTLDQFKTSLRKGKFKGLEGGRDLLPPMPWFNYKNASDDDLEAIFFYLRSIPAVKNSVPSPMLAGNN
jgi:hypothetical protein